MPPNPASEPQLGWEELTRAAAAVALLVTSMSALAVTGVLEQAQRNHSWWLYIALTLVLAAGVLWTLSLLTKTVWRSHRWALQRLAAGAMVAIPIVGAAPFLAETVTHGDSTKKVLAVLLAVSALAFGSSFFASERATRLSTMLAGSALAGLAVGILCGMVAVVQSQQDSPRPIITASITEGESMKLTAQIKVQDLSWEKHMRATVDAIVWQRDQRTGKPLRGDQGYLVTRTKERLYSVWLGPDKSGDVDHAVSWLLPAALRDEIAIHAWVVEQPPASCSVESPDDPHCPNEAPPPCYRFLGRFQAGCLKLRLIPALARPRISAALKRTGDAYVISAKVNARRVHESRTVRVRVLGFRPTGKAVTILSARVNPDDSGVVEGTWDAPIPAGLTRVCAAATFVAAQSGAQRSATRPACPPRARGAVAWTILVIPQS